MPDRPKSISRHLEPTFLRGAFLERWESVSEDLRPPLLETWAGPWQPLRHDGEPDPVWAWEIRRAWECDRRGEPVGYFLSYPLASLVAALLPYVHFHQGYSVLRQADAIGFPVELEGVRLGYLRSGGPGQLKRLESALRVSEFFAASPEALAAVLETAGYAVGVEALEIVAARVSA